MGVGIILLLQDIVQSLSRKQKLENIMEKQMLPELKPLRLGELLDQAIRLYRKHFLTFIGNNPSVKGASDAAKGVPTSSRPRVEA